MDEIFIREVFVLWSAILIGLGWQEDSPLGVKHEIALIFCPKGILLNPSFSHILTTQPSFNNIRRSISRDKGNVVSFTIAFDMNAILIGELL